MKRYGDDLPFKHMEESENQSGKPKYLAGNCAVRQDMVAFIIPKDETDNHKTRNIFSFLKFGQKKTEAKGS